MQTWRIMKKKCSTQLLNGTIFHSLHFTYTLHVEHVQCKQFNTSSLGQQSACIDWCVCIHSKSMLFTLDACWSQCALAINHFPSGFHLSTLRAILKVINHTGNYHEIAWCKHDHGNHAIQWRQTTHEPSMVCTNGWNGLEHTTDHDKV